jgi:hypothetical protein
MAGIPRPVRHQMFDPKEGFQFLVPCLGRLGIEYFVAGSLASSLHGIYRQTNDVDLVARVGLNQVETLARELQPEFYADAQMMRSAILHGRSFNLIHLRTSFKFDIFPLVGPFHESEMARREMVDGSPAGLNGIVIPTASAEDTILSKLSWYRGADQSSSQQWKDLLSVVNVKRDTLDRAYLSYWAKELGVEDLLNELLG